MSFLKRFTTSEKISYSLGLFHLISLILLVLAINVGYFFIWYNDQKEMSLSEMNKKYTLLSMPESDMEIEEFKKYLLEQDTLIIPDHGEMVCSPSLNEKIHNDIEKINNSYIYRFEGKIYFIFSAYYENVGRVKVLFDTTPYVQSQIMIFKISFFFIIFSLIISLILGRKITQIGFQPLKAMSEKAKDISLEKSNTLFSTKGPAQDEIRILAETLNRMLEKIESQATTLKQFTTDMSHEFKTPLMVMSTHIDLIEKKYTGKENIQFLGQLRKSIKHLNTLLETLLLIARFEEKGNEGQKIKIQVRPYIELRKNELFSVYKEKDINFTLTIPQNLIYEIHESSFQIIIDNLLTNAFKFTNKGGEIKVEATKKGLRVSDTGKGMTKKEQENIFEKFYRADKSSTGFGIGLYLVKRIVDINAWKIQVESEVNKGTTFFIEF